MRYTVLVLLVACGVQPQLGETITDLTAEPLTKTQLECQVDFFNKDFNSLVASSQVLSVDGTFTSSYALPVADDFGQTQVEFTVRGTPQFLSVENFFTQQTETFIDFSVGRTLKHGTFLQGDEPMVTRFGTVHMAHFWCQTQNQVVPAWGFQPQLTRGQELEVQAFVQDRDTLVVDFTHLLRKRTEFETLHIDVDGTLIEVLDSNAGALETAEQFVSQLAKVRPDLKTTLDPRDDQQDSSQASFATVTVVRSAE